MEINAVKCFFEVLLEFFEVDFIESYFFPIFALF